MPHDYVVILAAMGLSYPTREGQEITGQQELIATLPKVTKANEFSFEDGGSFHHLSPLEDKDSRWIYKIGRRLSAQLPTVTFLNLSHSMDRIIKDIQHVRIGAPFSIFVLYSDDSEYQRFFSELTDSDAAWFRHFFTLRKDDSEFFPAKVRNVLDKAVATAVYKIENSQLFSAFISYSHKDRRFAEWLHDKIRGAGIKCWLDEKQIRAGDRIHSKIEDAIYDRDKILLCASKHSLTSWWVENEINSVISKEQQLWKERGKETLSLIPLNLDGFMFSKEWQSGWKNQIKSRFAVDFTDWDPDHYYHGIGIQKILEALIVDETKGHRPFD
jgi:hypothetical protein